MLAALCFAMFMFATMHSDALRMDAKAAELQLYDAEGMYEYAEDAIFYLRVLRVDGTVQAVGTGVVITADGRAATAFHVIEGGAQFEAVFQDGMIVDDIEIIASDKWTDIAILQLHDFVEEIDGENDPSDRFLPIRSSAVRHGEKVFALGYPLKNTSLITEGIVNTPRAEINGRNRILVSAQVAGGMSGGPILDKQGYVVGIISGSLRTMNNIHVVIDMEDVHHVLATQ